MMVKNKWISTVSLLAMACSLSVTDLAAGKRKRGESDSVSAEDGLISAEETSAPPRKRQRTENTDAENEVIAELVRKGTYTAGDLVEMLLNKGIAPHFPRAARKLANFYNNYPEARLPKKSVSTSDACFRGGFMRKYKKIAEENKAAIKAIVSEAMDEQEDDMERGMAMITAVLDQGIASTDYLAFITLRRWFICNKKKTSGPESIISVVAKRMGVEETPILTRLKERRRARAVASASTSPMDTPGSSVATSGAGSPLTPRAELQGFVSVLDYGSDDGGGPALLSPVAGYEFFFPEGELDPSYGIPPKSSPPPVEHLLRAMGADL